MRHILASVCDTFDGIVEVLAEFLDKHRCYYLKFDNQNDFRVDCNGLMTLLGSGGEGVQFAIPKEHFNTFVGLITSQIFGADRVVFTWDVKRMFSYITHRIPRNQVLDVPCTMIDIKYGEAFLGIDDGKQPETFEDAKTRARPVAKNEQCRWMQSKVEIPLATRVLPKIETYGYKDCEDRLIKHSIYEIGGKNGRLKSRPLGDFGVNAHGMKHEDRLRFRPSQDCVFVDIDYKSMEVFVLQWLTNDPRLGKIIESGRDIYSTIYSLLYGRRCTDENRQFIKKVFLPIVYGLRAGGLQTSYGLERAEADLLLTKINGFFETAMGWIQTQQDRLKVDSVVSDRFGRLRRYEDNHHAVRNQVVQGPAATVCQDRLVALYDRLYKSCEIVATVHDEYILDVPERQLYDVVFYAVETLQAPSEIAPGLKLKVDVKIGKNLADLQPYNI